MYELIVKNKRKSIIVFFAMGLLMIALGGGIGWVFDGGAGNGVYVGIIIAIIVWAIQALIAYKRGAKVVLSEVDAKEITKQDDAVLYNIIEELSMSSGLPMPKIYLIDTPAMNAFAAGTKPETSIVAITKGLRQRLNRQEIQGVMAHEMSHIYNRDVLYMTFASVMMCTIVLISEILTKSFLYGGIRRKSNDKNGAAQIVLIILLVVFAVFAAFLARLFYFSLSRKREYLADTMAVNFTHDPSALADALQKISGDNTEFNPGKMASAMCISMPNLKQKAASLLSTHPPIYKRIAILRAMNQGTSYENYCKAYETIMGKNDLPKQK